MSERIVCGFIFVTFYIATGLNPNYEPYTLPPRGQHTHDIYPPRHNRYDNYRSNIPGALAPWSNQPYSYKPHRMPQFPPGSRHSSINRPKNTVRRQKDVPTSNEVDFNHNINKIPQEIFEKYDELNVDEFLKLYVAGYEEEPKLDSRFEKELSQKGVEGFTSNAQCRLEPTVVPLIDDDNPNIFYIPRCTRIDRCSGCCANDVVSCQAIEMEIVNLEVVKAEYIDGLKLKFSGKQEIPVERHIKCKCDCKVKPEQCHGRQVYSKSECACNCPNTNEEFECYKDVNKKEWDLGTCSCKCKGFKQCSTGTVYDHKDCQCKHK